MTSRLVEDTTLRYKKEVIRSMVREYYNQQKGKEEAKKPEDAILVEDRGRKKKKIDCDYRYEPKINHSLDDLGGI